MPTDDSPLTRLTKHDLSREHVPVIDAVAAFLRDGEQPAPEVQEQIDGRRLTRWYPTKGGNHIKMPYQGDPVPMEHFHVEPGGWDHYHCDGCGNASA